MSEVLREWGSCGRVALVDGVAVGYLTYAPPSYVPGAALFPTAPASPDAVLLTTAYVADGYDGAGIGRLLVQGMARDLVGRGGIKAVEAFAYGGSRLAPDGGCLLPAEFLARVGFKTHRPHPRTPRMRMEMRSLVSWRDEVEAAIERLVGAVRPEERPPPPTATSTSRNGIVPDEKHPEPVDRGAFRQGLSRARPTTGQTMKSDSSLRIAAFGRAPTMVFTTSPFW